MSRGSRSINSYTLREQCDIAKRALIKLKQAQLRELKNIEKMSVMELTRERAAGSLDRLCADIEALQRHLDFLRDRLTAGEVDNPIPQV